MDEIEKHTKEIAIAYYNRGNAYYNQGLYDEAIEDFTKAIELDPGYVSAYDNRGNAYAEKGGYGKALERLNKKEEK